GNIITVTTLERKKKDEADRVKANDDQNKADDDRRAREQKMMVEKGLLRQVLIEAKIVEASENFVRTIGVQWGFGSQQKVAAGSTYGTTSDPMRAAVWLWLGSHLTPFHITSNEITGYLSYLPIGAAIFPILTMRVGYRRVSESVSNKKIGRAYFIISYLLVYLLLAVVASNSQVSVDWFRGVPTLLILLLLATTNLNAEHLVKTPFYFFAIMLGLGGLLLSISLCLNFSTAKNLTIVIQPGILGGLLLLLLQLLYLPNIIFTCLSYGLGSGFSLGSATDITPFIFNLREIPAIPVLAALPNGKYPWLIVLTLIVAIYAWVNINLINRQKIDEKSKQQKTIRFFLISTFIPAIFAFISSGSLLSANMSPVGVNPIRIGAIFALQVLIVFILMKYLPRLFKKKQGEGRLAT
ncbi:MAG: hypothetical protein RL725_445, partial [Actinomycetota bacterium]